MKAINIPVLGFKPSAGAVKKFSQQFWSRVSTLVKELGTALGQMSKKNLIKMTVSITSTAFKCTYRHKADFAKSIGGSLLRGGIRIKEKFGEYRSKGLYSVIKSDYNAAVKSTKKGMTKVAIVVGDFNDMNYEQKKAVMKYSVIYAMFFIPVLLIVGGGLDMEGGAPDLDMPMGEILGKGPVGLHRNIFSHTILAGLGIEVIVRIAIGVVREVYKYLPENHDQIWDDINKIMPTAESAVVSGAWLGIASHLIKDSSLLSGGYEARVKAYNGLPFRMADNMHQNMFAANGFVAGGLAASELTPKQK